jgi:hypothetical protein
LAVVYAEMARDISVYRADDIELRSGKDWMVREGATWLFDAPLGSESAIREWWSAPAVSLGLPLLASIYDHGFSHGIRWGGSELKQVLDELSRLAEYWTTANGLPDVGYSFAERAQYLRQAIAVAENCGGIVVIT